MAKAKAMLVVAAAAMAAAMAAAKAKAKAMAKAMLVAVAAAVAAAISAAMAAAAKAKAKATDETRPPARRVGTGPDSDAKPGTPHPGAGSGLGPKRDRP